MYSPRSSIALVGLGDSSGALKQQQNPTKLKHEGNQCKQSTETPKLSVGKIQHATFPRHCKQEEKKGPSCEISTHVSSVMFTFDFVLAT